MTKKDYAKLAIALLCSTIVVATFIDSYGRLFDGFGTMAKQRLLDHPLLTFFVTPAFFWVSAFLCWRYSPYAASNHLQTTIDHLKSEDITKAQNYLSAPMVITKAISSLGASFGGGALGKEGPSIHMAASIFVILHQRFRKFIPQISLKGWFVSGGAIGLFAVFNTPLAAIAFSCEKLLRIGHINLFKKDISWAVFCIFVAAIFFHSPEPTFNFHAVNFNVTHWKFLLLISLTCGLIASPMRQFAFYCCHKIINIKSKWWHIIPITFGLIVACINSYSGVYSFSGGIQTIEQTLLGNIVLSESEVIGRIINTLLTFASGCAGGLIAPAMAIGTGIGSIFSGLFPTIDGGVFLLLGMTSFLAVFLGEPVTASLIVLESTKQEISSLPFFLLSAIIALLIKKYFRLDQFRNFLDQGKKSLSKEK